MSTAVQEPLDLALDLRVVEPYKTQLLKWIGNKQRFAHIIASYFPLDMRRYHEPFLGSGAVLATLKPEQAVAGDIYEPLVGIWTTLASDPHLLVEWYEERWARFASGDRTAVYAEILASFNAKPNSADFLFLTRSCYGGVVRFRQADGAMSTPLGAHDPITPGSFAARVEQWADRTKGAKFVCADFEEVMDGAQAGDVVYCDPPYVFSQTILYGAQAFSLERLWAATERAKRRGVRVVVSIDGTKKTGDVTCEIPLPDDLFEDVVLIDGGRSMLRRFQRAGQQLQDDVVADRLLLTF